jgi:hypothetical protein
MSQPITDQELQRLFDQGSATTTMDGLRAVYAAGAEGRVLEGVAKIDLRSANSHSVTEQMEGPIEYDARKGELPHEVDADTPKRGRKAKEANKEGGAPLTSETFKE